MRLPHIPLPWLGVGLLVVAAIVLYQFPHAMEVTLHLRTERLSFVLPERRVLLESQPLTSLTLQGFGSMPLVVKELREGGRLLVSSDRQVVLKALTTEATLMLTGSGLRLMRLAFAAGTQVVLYTDREHHLLLQAQHSPMSELELAVSERFTLTGNHMVLQDAQGKDIAAASSQPARHLEVTPAIKTLRFEQEAQGPVSLVIDLSRQIREAGWPLLLPVAPRLKVVRLDVMRETGTTRVPAIQQLWIDPLVPQDKPLDNIYLQVRDSDIFTLQSTQLAEQGLVYELTGHTDTLLVGKERPQKNLVPSWLEYLINHGIVQNVCKFLGKC